MTPEKSTVDLIQRTLWQAFEVLRGEFGIFLTGTDFHLVTVLLHLHQEGALDGLAKTDPKWARQELFERMYELTRGEPTREIYSAFKSTIDKVSEPAFHRLMDIFNSLAPSATKGSYTEWVETCVETVTQFGGKAFGEHLQPKELTRFIIGLADLPAGASIYNPFGGAASFGILLQDGGDYEGEEINAQIAAVGLIRLMASPRSGSYSFGQGDSIKGWKSTVHPYDLIVANLPFNLRLKEEVPGFGSSLSVESFFFIRAVECLKASGKAIAVVPNGFLFGTRQDQKNVKEWLLRKDLLDTVISFPSGLLTHTGIQFSVVVIDLAKKRPSKVRFVIADRFVVNKPKERAYIDDRGLLLAIEAHVDPSIQRWVSVSELLQNESDLSPKRYFVDAGDVSGVPLSELLTPVRGQRLENGITGRLVKIKNLKEDPLDHALDVEDVVPSTIIPGARRIDKSALLIALRWKSLKPTWFEYKGEPIYATADISAYSIDAKLTEAPYLILQLLSERVSKQAQMLRVGDVIPMLRAKDLLSIRVELGTLDEQHEAVVEEKANLLRQKQKELKELEERLGVEGIRVKDNSFLRHSIAGPLGNVRYNFRALKAQLESAERLNRPLKLSVNLDGSDKTMADVLEAMRYSLALITEETNKSGRHKIHLEDEPLKPLNLPGLLDSFVAAHQSDVYSLGISYDSGMFQDNESRSEVFIECNESLFHRLLSNVLANAEEHAFHRIRSASNKVDIWLTKDDVSDPGMIQLRVSNTGHCFAENFDTEKFIQLWRKGGASSGDGFGGHLIDMIVKKFKGSFAIDMAPEDGRYATVFLFKFPLVSEA